jgi:hypothetical protein
VKKFTVPCNFGGKQAPFTIYIGLPDMKHHPLHFQSEWLSKNRGGSISGDVMDSISKLFELSKKNRVSFEELCVYALTSEDIKSATKKTPAPGEEAPPPPPE